MSDKPKWFIADNSYDLSPEAVALRITFAEVEKRFMSMFGRIRLGHPWWFWCEDAKGRRFVLYVCIDGSGSFWADVDGHGRELFSYLVEEKIKVVCPVEEPK